ncbi:nickel-dependent hydrogenase large subunit [Candidatus Bathyarchaeota archaeon]|nr:nickel-dependent hydrogenase large subunit [Candidatus Bathyarchaeota archaeon]
MSENVNTNKKYSVLPFGPQHPVLPEPIHLKFIVDEEKIIDVLPNLGYVHRGIERGCELNDYKRNIWLTERICGICNYIHGATYCAAIEKITDTEVPVRAKYLRTIWGELGRLQSHLLWLGLFADAIGFESLFMQIWRDREIVLTLNEKTNGHRIHLATNMIGGARKDIDDSLENEYKKDLNLLRKKMDALKPVFYKDSAIKQKCEGKGILSKNKARFLGATGPTIRGSGLKEDARLTGYEAYGQLDFKPVVYEGEDSYSRMLVRFDEVLQSIDLIEKAFDQMPEGPILNKNDKFPMGHTVIRTEQPRGEVFYYVEGNGTNKLTRCKIRTPTASNIPALINMLIGYEVSDIPTIVHSIDPCISCTERIVYVRRNE